MVASEGGGGDTNSTHPSGADVSTYPYTWWDVVVAGGFTVVPAAMWVTALSYNSEARRIPLLIATPLTLLAAVELFSRVRDVFRNRKTMSATPRDGEALDAAPDRHGRSGSAYLQPFALLSGFVLSFVVLGQMAGTAIFAFVFLWGQRELRLVGAATFAGVLTGLLWMTAHLLEVEFHQGVWYGLIS